MEVMAPSRSGDETFRAWLARGERLGVAPDLVGSNWFLDVRGLLSAVTVPTLVLHRGGNRFVQAGAGRYMAERIPDARFVELPGDDHLFFVVRLDDVVGLTVSISKRICDLAGPGEVFVSEAVKLHLAGSGIALSDQGVCVLKGVPDEWRLFGMGE
jgi:hypothetical protein